MSTNYIPHVRIHATSSGDGNDENNLITSDFTPLEANLYIVVLMIMTSCYHLFILVKVYDMYTVGEFPHKREEINQIFTHDRAGITRMLN